MGVCYSYKQNLEIKQIKQKKQIIDKRQKKQKEFN